MSPPRRLALPRGAPDRPGPQVPAAAARPAARTAGGSTARSCQARAPTAAARTRPPPSRPSRRARAGAVRDARPWVLRVPHGPGGDVITRHHAHAHHALPAGRGRSGCTALTIPPLPPPRGVTKRDTSHRHGDTPPPPRAAPRHPHPHCAPYSASQPPPTPAPSRPSPTLPALPCCPAALICMRAVLTLRFRAKTFIFWPRAGGGRGWRGPGGVPGGPQRPRGGSQRPLPAAQRRDQQQHLGDGGGDTAAGGGGVTHWGGRQWVRGGCRPPSPPLPPDPHPPAEAEERPKRAPVPALERGQGQGQRRRRVRAQRCRRVKEGPATGAAPPDTANPRGPARGTPPFRLSPFPVSGSPLALSPLPWFQGVPSPPLG